MRKNYKKFLLFMKENAIFRVRDWKDYGIV